ncbi:hydrolase [Actinorhabdospora filicis]|uniref:Hydrolase n=1 Tax=Actinorhabdospora filicis TaxID=1785913 RepID=A0A9W6WEJ4_9ACTN|nr:alpha/beta hydrolase [Actinorhabdospora filicis]GLZ81935.1 hydrolase [Actinorhabdospora filicis]
MKRAVIAPDEAVPSIEVQHGPWPGRDHLIDGMHTFVRETPPTAPGAEPALYVHGLGGSAQNWTDLADVLATRLDGQAIDLPGFGRSEPSRRYTIPAMAERVISWIEFAQRGPVHLFGNSLGGAVSVYVAGKRPDLVRSLTLISPAMPFLDPSRSVHSRMVPLLAIPRADRIAIRALARMTPAQLVDQVAQNCWADPSTITEVRRAEAVAELEYRMSLPWHADAYVRSFRGLVSSFIRAYLPGSGSLWRLAGHVTAPTLVVWGKQDKLVDVRLAPQVARAIPDSRMLILDKVGHLAQMEAPRAVARAFVGMLDEIMRGDVDDSPSSSSPSAAPAAEPRGN